MINYTQKWWLLGCHRRAEKIHSTRDSCSGEPVNISQSFFIKGNLDKETADKWYGLANKYPGKVSGEKKYRYVKFRLSWLKFWEKEYDDEKLKANVNDYWDIYEACVDDGYITPHKITGYPTVSNSKAYRIRGVLGYFWGLLNEYDKVTTALITIIGLMISFYVGTFVNNKVQDNEPEQIPIINNITTPDVNPVINVYPNK